MIEEVVLGLMQVFVRPITDALEKHKPEWRGCLLATSIVLALVASVALLILVIVLRR